MTQRFPSPRGLAARALPALLAVLMPLSVLAQTAPAAADVGASSGPIRLRQPQVVNTDDRDADALRDGASYDPRSRALGTAGAYAGQPMSGQARTLPPPAPSDFEVYVRRLNEDRPVRRFGSELLSSLYDTADGGRHSAPVPADYTLRPGDEIVVTLWGSVDADLRLQIDRSGRVAIPRVGPIMLAGVRYADAPDVISRRVGQVFKNFSLSVTLGQLRGLRVYVTGFVHKPGAVNTQALSTLTQALMQAGGPSAAGSFRQVQLRRGGQLVGQFDLYDLLLNGNRGGDLFLQSEDVVHVGPVGRQVALIGSVNRPAIFELKPNETVTDLLRMAGGFSPVADASRLAVDRFGDRASGRTVQWNLPTDARNEPVNGDVLRAFNAAEVALPSERQNKRVRIEGEVARPGDYLLPPDSTLADVMAAAGGTTSKAFVYATVFTRESVRRTQQENYERALRDLETQMTTYNATRRTATAEEATAVSASSAATSRFLEQLRALKPSGRVVLQLNPQSIELPPLALEDGDRLVIPSRPTTVGVFGSVFNTGSYLYSGSRTVGDYLRLAGGPTRGADQASVFVVRANGTVTSGLHSGGWFSRGSPINEAATEPGDTIFVPEEMDKTTFIQMAKDWTQIMYQFGLGIAGIVSATR